MSLRYYMGIDPGSKGGIAVIDEERNVRGLIKMPDSITETISFFRLFSGRIEHAYCEKVGGYVGGNKNKDGGKGNTGSSMFVFGRSVGILHTCLSLINLVEGNNLTLVIPNQWMRGLSLRTKHPNEKQPSWKRYLGEYAKTLFPKIRVTDHTGDCLLIAEYCRMMREEMLSQEIQ